ncbi:MAG: phosphoribosylanthranilate isomerase [Anaerohalosphaeraceae bacterium]|nr:phosphoribosylanthranilate isomerase [Anaerohalosphaeraceae bacterium]
MATVKIKICGITNAEDAAWAVECGADLLGFNFYSESPRYIKPENAEKIINKLPAYVDLVGLFVNAESEEVHKISSGLHLDWVQLHGDESPGFCLALNWLPAQIIKAVRVRDVRDIEYARNFAVDALLLDAYHPELYGGTGQRFDWNTLPNLTGHVFGRTFLAGGINPENVAEALGHGFYGLDVCSGIESSPGKKDHKKMKELFDKIRSITG